MLTALDESFLHQAPLTFAVATTSDHRFYDRAWLAAYDPAGGTALNFGLAVYKNMNVVDGFCCVVRGTRQRNLRVSRQLRPEIDMTAAGPVRYSVVEPFRRVRVEVAAGEHGVACDLDWRSPWLPFVERPTVTDVNGRTATDVQRYDQPGTVDGWIEFGGERIPVDGWFGARDHSWGVRGGVGGFEPATGVAAVETGFLITWLLFATDEMSGYVQRNRDGTGAETFVDGRLRWHDGRPERSLRRVDQEIEFPPGSRAYRRASMRIVDSEGDTHEILAERLSEPIVMRGAGYDGGFDDGRGLGVHRGQEHAEWDEYDLASEDTPTTVPDGNAVAGVQREQPVSLSVNGAAGVGDLTVVALGDCSHFGVTLGAKATP